MDQEAMKEPAASTPVWDELEEWTRGRIQEWMQQLLVEEVTEFLGRAKHQRRGVDMQGYRNGYGKPRRLTMRSGTVTVRRPRVRDLDERFESRLLPLFTRRTQEVRDLLPELYLHGLASGDFELALRGLLGEQAPLSASTVARAKERWQAEYSEWQQRPDRGRDRVPVVGRRVPESGTGEGEGGVVGGHRSETGRPQGGAGGEQRLPRVDGVVEQPAARSEGAGDE